ncbi:MAG: hypothetical protein CMJ83_00925 [Planctomycetes bacterium]|nr:hypothetical protein [Planctomycetota bacterium]
MRRVFSVLVPLAIFAVGVTFLLDVVLPPSTYRDVRYEVEGARRFDELSGIDPDDRPVDGLLPWGHGLPRGWAHADEVVISAHPMGLRTVVAIDHGGDHGAWRPAWWSRALHIGADLLAFLLSGWFLVFWFRR